DGAQIRQRVATASSGQTQTWESTYDPPCVLNRFPMGVGDAWNSTCTATTRVSSGSGPDRSSTMNETHRYRVLREESVHVPPAPLPGALLVAAALGGIALLRRRRT